MTENSWKLSFNLVITNLIIIFLISVGCSALTARIKANPVKTVEQVLTIGLKIATMIEMFGEPDIISYNGRNSYQTNEPAIIYYHYTNKIIETTNGLVSAILRIKK